MGSVKIKDKPGTVRVSPTGDYAILTTDKDEAPWFCSYRGGERVWATFEEIRDWDVRGA